MTINRHTRTHSILVLHLGLLLGFAAAHAQVVKVRLNSLEIGIDGETGSIVSLNSPYSDSLLQALPESAGLLDVAYPIDSFAAMRLASRFSRATVTQPRADEVDIRWDHLGASRPHLPLPAGAVSGRVTIRAADDGRSIILTCHIENGSKASVRQELFPDLWGLKPIEGVENTRLRLPRSVVKPFDGPVLPLDPSPFYTEERWWKVYPAGGFYKDNALRWLDFGGFESGLSIFQRKWGSDDRPDVFTRRTEKNPNSLRLAWEQKADIAPGQSWDSGEFWVTPHPGGWAKGIEVYRDYVNQLNPPRALPANVRNDIGFQTIWMTQSIEVDPAKAAFQYRDLSRVAEDAKKYGIHEVVPWGWCTYVTLPIPSLPQLGTEADLVQAVRRAKDMGVNIAPFISIVLERNSSASRYNATPGTEDWTYHPELIPVFRPYYTTVSRSAGVNTNNKVWEQDVISSLTDWINKGVASFSWDVFEEKSENGARPGLLRTIEMVRSRARARDPQSSFSGESIVHLEWDTSVLDYTWNWLDYTDAAPITSVLRTPRLNCDVESSPLVVKECFADNLFLNVMPRKLDQPNGTALISEKPGLGSALREVSRLRAQFLPYFVDGIFLGDSILKRPVEGFVRGYQFKDKMLIIVLNDKRHSAATSVQADLAWWLPKANKYSVKRFDAAGELKQTTTLHTPYWVGTTEQLEPEGVTLFEIHAE